MPKASLRATTTTKQDIKLTTKQVKTLRTELKDILEINRQIKELKAALVEPMAAVEAIREDVGCKTLDFEGVKITRVGGDQKKINYQMMIDEGWISPTQLEEATSFTPKKAYTKVSAPGDKDED